MCRLDRKYIFLLAFTGIFLKIVSDKWANYIKQKKKTFLITSEFQASGNIVLNAISSRNAKSGGVCWASLFVRDFQQKFWQNFSNITNWRQREPPAPFPGIPYKFVGKFSRHHRVNKMQNILVFAADYERLGGAECRGGPRGLYRPAVFLQLETGFILAKHKSPWEGIQ